MNSLLRYTALNHGGLVIGIIKELILGGGL
jgi:hypothetical protein